jgi:hypothetical protein
VTEKNGFLIRLSPGSCRLEREYFVDAMSCRVRIWTLGLIRFVIARRAVLGTRGGICKKLIVDPPSSHFGATSIFLGWDLAGFGGIA